MNGKTLRHWLLIFAAPLCLMLLVYHLGSWLILQRAVTYNIYFGFGEYYLRLCVYILTALLILWMARLRDEICRQPAFAVVTGLLCLLFLLPPILMYLPFARHLASLTFYVVATKSGMLNLVLLYGTAYGYLCVRSIRLRRKESATPDSFAPAAQPPSELSEE